MIIFPAIDLIDGKVVRLKKGDYDNMTVYGDDPVSTAKDFERSGAEFLHTVDLQGALRGADGNNTINSDTVKNICQSTRLKVQVGGGIRNDAVIRDYLDNGVYRVILGTAAVEHPQFLRESVKRYGGRIAVGVDIKDGFVATHGWTKSSKLTCFEFVSELMLIGVKTIICTDVSKDGMMSGTNLELYGSLSDKYDIDIIASGGVSSISDIRALCEMNIYGAILGKALYSGAVDLGGAIELANSLKGKQ